jgi:O-antigen/teichoic acid export membrane protein
MGRGTLFVMISTFVFFLGGYVIQVGLGRYLGPVEYGTFGVILTIMNMVNLFLTYGFPKSAAKYIAEGKVKTGSIIKTATRVQLIFCTLGFIIYLGLSSVIANLLNDPGLTRYIMLSSISIPAYALFAIYSGGYLNGMRRFGRQALVSIVNSLGKVGLVFIFVLIGWGVNGAILGYIGSSLFGLVLAFRFVRPIEKGEDTFSWKQLLSFGIPVTVFAVLFFLLMSIDLYAVKALDAVKADVGYYTAASTISKLSYYLFAGLAITLLPSISKSTSTGNVEQTGNYIRRSMRYMTLILLPVTLLISATSSGLTELIYSSTYINAAEPLSILVLGLALLSVFSVLNSVIMGAGKPGVAVWIILPLVLMDILLNIYLIPRYGLTGAALATTSTGFVGMCAVAIYVYWKFKALVNALSALKIVLASVVIYLIAVSVSVPPAWLVLLYIGLAALYAVMLWVLREIQREDIEMVKKIVNIGNSK